MTQSQEARASRGGGLAGAIGWAVIFWLIGRIVAPRLASWADSADLWLKNYADNPNTQDLFQFLIAAPVILLSGLGITVLHLLAGAFGFAQRLFLTAFVGFLFGLSAAAPSALFVRAGAALAAMSRLVALSAVEVFTMKRASHRLWALAPVVAAGFIMFFAFRLVERHWPTNPPPVQQIERFRPTRTWRAAVPSDAGGDGAPFSVAVTTVDVERDRIGITLRFRNDSASPQELRVSDHSSLRMNRERALASRWLFVAGDDRRLTRGSYVGPGSEIEGTLFFARPTSPFEAWWLTLEYRTAAKLCSGTMYLDLGKSPF